MLFLTHLLLNPYNNLSTKYIRSVLVNGGQLPKTGMIFERQVTYAGVMQVKKPPRRLTVGVWQPVAATGTGETAPDTSRTRKDSPEISQVVAVNRHPGSDTASTSPENNAKHHGSESRQLALVAGRIAPHLKTQVLKRAKAKGWSESKTVADLVQQALENDLAGSFSVSLTNSLTEALTTKVGKEYNRAANLALEAFNAAEEGRIIAIYTLRFILGDADLLAEVIEEARREARESLKRYSYAAAPEGEGYGEHPRQEVAN
jgi:hypothetical protein